MAQGLAFSGRMPDPTQYPTVASCFRNRHARVLVFPPVRRSRRLDCRFPLRVRPGVPAGRGRRPDDRARRVLGHHGRGRAADPPAVEHQFRRPRSTVGVAIPAIPQPGRAEGGLAGPLPPNDLGQGTRAAAARADGARPNHDPVRPGRERRLHEIERLHQRAEPGVGLLPGRWRGVRGPTPVLAVLSRQERGRRAGRRSGSEALRVRDGRHALGRQLAAMGAGRLAVRGGREHQHLQDQEPGEAGCPGRRISTGDLALSPRTSGVRVVLRGRREHLRARLRPTWSGHCRDEPRQQGNAAPGSGGVPHQGVQQARAAAQPAHLRLLRSRPVYRIQGRARHLRRGRLSGRRFSGEVPQ